MKGTGGKIEAYPNALLDKVILVTIKLGFQARCLASIGLLCAVHPALI